jgi:hypothetical protein
VLVLDGVCLWLWQQPEQPLSGGSTQWVLAAAGTVGGVLGGQVGAILVRL